MTDLQPSQTLSIHHADFSDVIKAFMDKARALSRGEILFIVFLTMLVMVGNAMQVISLNFWLRDFGPGGASNFTAFAVSNLFFFLFFLVAFLIYYCQKRPNLDFLWTKKSMWLLMVIGFGDMFNSELNLYATKGTPEILQTLFNSCQPLFCFIFSRWILNDKRPWMNWWCLGSFVLMIAGVCIASGPDFADGSAMSTSKKWWSFIFFLSTPLQSWYNVVQSQYMEDFTDKTIKDGDDGDDEDGKGSQIPTVSLNNNADAETINESMDGAIFASPAPPSRSSMKGKDMSGSDVEKAPLIPKSSNSNPSYGGAKDAPGARPGAAAAAAAAAVSSPASPSDAEAEDPATCFCCCTPCDCCCNCCKQHYDTHPKGSDEAVKLSMLLGDTFFQFIFSLMALPADAIPWYGESKTVAHSWDNFIDGLKCVFTCKNNGAYALAYISGFICMYVGCAYLNAYSPTLCSMLQQLAGPVAAVLLLIVPAWNLNAGAAAWYYTVGAIVVLLVATCIYSVWEEMSELDHDEEERVEHIKEERAKASEPHFAADADDVDGAAPASTAAEQQ